MELTPLQRDLPDSYLDRNFNQICELFNGCGINLKAEISSRLIDPIHSRDLTIVDVGCGKGNSIEHAMRGSSISAKNLGTNKSVTGIGIDLNPLRDIDDDILRFGNESGFDERPLAHFLKGDATKLPLQDSSVDVLYSGSTLLYVEDTLKAIEEGYRVLKNGGIAVWSVPEKYISVVPSFKDILANTPGASRIFQYIPGNGTGFIVCRKSEGMHFKGFPYKLVNVLTRYPESGSYAQFFRSGVYQALEEMDL